VTPTDPEPREPALGRHQRPSPASKHWAGVKPHAPALRGLTPDETSLDLESPERRHSVAQDKLTLDTRPDDRHPGPTLGLRDAGGDQ
jgi:hypothetical protein